MTILDKILHRIPVDDSGGADTYDAALTRMDFAAAEPLLRAAIKKNDARAMGALAAMYVTGQGVEKDPEEAYLWFRQAAAGGDLQSQCVLGMFLAGGVGTPVNLQESVYWLFLASKAGNTRAFEVLEPMVEKNKSLIGPHFTEQEFVEMAWRFKKLVSKLPSSNTVH